MDAKAESAWKWALRILGIAGFIFLLVTDRNAPVAFYVLLGGLLGLPNIITYQMTLNQQNKALAEQLAQQAASSSSPGESSPKDV